MCLQGHENLWTWIHRYLFVPLTCSNLTPASRARGSALLWTELLSSTLPLAAGLSIVKDTNRMGQNIQVHLPSPYRRAGSVPRWRLMGSQQRTELLVDWTNSSTSTFVDLGESDQNHPQRSSESHHSCHVPCGDTGSFISDRILMTKCLLHWPSNHLPIWHTQTDCLLLDKSYLALRTHGRKATVWWEGRNGSKQSCNRKTPGERMCGHRGREEGIGHKRCHQGMETGGRLAVRGTMVPGKRNKEVRLSRSQETDGDEPSILRKRDCDGSHRCWSHWRILSREETHVKWERISRKIVDRVIF